jgi:hypothetical protein
VIRTCTGPNRSTCRKGQPMTHSTKKHEFHPLANLFEPMEGEELQALADDIKENGLRELIICTEDGRIIDGRNRYNACMMVGEEPKFGVREDDGKLPEWVWSRNGSRRHVTPSKLAYAAAEFEKITGRLPPLGRPSKEMLQKKRGPVGPISGIAEVPDTSLKRARKVVRSGSKSLQKAVKKGDVSVSAAARVADLPKAEQRALVRQGPEAVVEAARPEPKADDHKVKPSQIMGSMEMLEANWIAASAEIKNQFSAKYGKKQTDLPVAQSASDLPAPGLSRADMLSVIDRFKRQAVHVNDVALCDWMIHVVFAVTGNVVTPEIQERRGKTNQIGRPFPAPGSMLKANPPSGKNGAVRK